MIAICLLLKRAPEFIINAGVQNSFAKRNELVFTYFSLDNKPSRHFKYKQDGGKFLDRKKGGK